MNIETEKSRGVVIVGLAGVGKNDHVVLASRLATHVAHINPCVIIEATTIDLLHHSILPRIVSFHDSVLPYQRNNLEPKNDFPNRVFFSGRETGEKP